MDCVLSVVCTFRNIVKQKIVFCFPVSTCEQWEADCWNMTCVPCFWVCTHEDTTFLCCKKTKRRSLSQSRSGFWLPFLRDPVAHPMVNCISLTGQLDHYCLQNWTFWQFYTGFRRKRTVPRASASETGSRHSRGKPPAASWTRINEIWLGGQTYFE